MNTYRICRATLTGSDEDEDSHKPTLKTKSSEAIFGQQRSFAGCCMNDSEVPTADILSFYVSLLKYNTTVEFIPAIQPCVDPVQSGLFQPGRERRD